MTISWRRVLLTATRLNNLHGFASEARVLPMKTINMPVDQQVCAIALDVAPHGRGRSAVDVSSRVPM